MNDRLYFKENKSNKWWIIVIVSIIVLWIVIPKISNLEIFMRGTNPKEIINKTTGKFILEERSPISLERYLEITIPEAEEKNYYGKVLNYTLKLPEVDFYFDYESEYYDYCQGKRVEINFSKTTYSNFSFNYKNKRFNYKISLYPDLYYFSRGLKNQDCYFSYDKYEEGYFKDPYNNKFIEALSKNFNNLKSEGYNDDEIVEISTIFVQSIMYGSDPEDVNRYPYETIYEAEGNCLDKSVILTGILKNLNYSTYLISGSFDYEDHAFVGLVCEKGNIKYEGKEICFIETTDFYPIGYESDIEIEEYIFISEGEKIYKGVNYGRYASNSLKEKLQNMDSILIRLDELDLELAEIQEKMYATDCVTIMPDGRIIDHEYCDDAYKWNKYTKEYNEVVEEYNQLIEDYYSEYYYIEQIIFENQVS